MMAVMGILMAVYKRQSSGRGSVIDVGMVDGSAYIASFIFKMKQSGMWNAPRGENALDSGGRPLIVD